MDTQTFRVAYSSLLEAYVDSQDEQHLTEAADLGREFVRAGVPLEEIAGIHEEAVQGLTRKLDGAMLSGSLQQVTAPLMALLRAFGPAVRQRAEEQSQPVEETLRETARVLLESQSVAQIGSYVLELPSGTWESSPTLDSIFGLSVDHDRTVNGWIEILHPDDRQSLGEYLTHDVIEKHGRFDRAYRILRRDDGQERWVQGLGKLEFDTDGHPVRMIGTIQDITERRQVEEEHERLSVAIDQAAEIIMITDKEGLVEYVNPAFEAITGYTCAETLGRNPRFLKSEMHDASFFKEMWSTLRGGEVWSGRIVNKRKDGTLYTEEAVISPMRDATGLMAGYVAVMRDISEEVRLEEQLRQAQKMESVGRLAGGVAHDFNNMLGVILGNTELAMDLADANQPLYAHLLEIHTATNRSANLTRQLLAFARKQTIAPRVLELNEVVDQMLTMLRRLIGEDIDLAWIPDANALSVKVDPSQIDQILANLCVNARDAIAGVGKVTIETGSCLLDEAWCVEHAEFSPGEYVLLIVSDNGAGMDKEAMTRIYEPYFTTKGQGKGTGLGMATVYGIVKQNNGFIDVSSELGRGTTFKIYLPRHAAKALQDENQWSREPSGRGHETILLVEDEPAILTMTTTMLEGQGYTVLPASTPGEAIEITETHPGVIHMLMTDVIMPEMNGRHLAKNILSFYPNLKRLFTSGYTADVIAHHGVLDEGVQFIQKPFTKDDLSSKVREVLDSQ